MGYLVSGTVPVAIAEKVVAPVVRKVNSDNSNVSVQGNKNKVNSPTIIINNGTIINGDDNKVGCNKNSYNNDRINQMLKFGMMSKMMNFFSQVMTQMLQMLALSQFLDQGNTDNVVCGNNWAA